jgi:hypothetical protein
VPLSSSAATIDQQLISESKEAHDKIVADLSESSSGSGRQSTSFRGKLRKIALWDRAKVVSLSVGPGVLIPLKFDDDYYAKIGDSGVEIPIKNTTHLLVYRGSDSKMHSEIVTTIPDENYFEGVATKPFTGSSVIEDWNGNFQKGYRYTKEGVTPILSSGQSTGKVQCIITDWYNCVSVGGGSSSCSYCCTTQTCADDGGGGGGGDSGGGTGGGDYGGGGGGGGGYGTGNPSDGYTYAQDPNHNRLCGSINFSKVGNSYTAQLYGLGLKAFHTGTGNQIQAQLSVVCLEIPSYGWQPYDAYEDFKLVWKQSMESILALMDAELLPAYAPAIRAEIVLQVQSRLRPGSRFSTGPCLGPVQSTYVEYCP